MLVQFVTQLNIVLMVAIIAAPIKLIFYLGNPKGDNRLKKIIIHIYSNRVNASRTDYAID